MVEENLEVIAKRFNNEITQKITDFTRDTSVIVTDIKLDVKRQPVGDNMSSIGYTLYMQFEKPVMGDETQ